MSEERYCDECGEGLEEEDGDNLCYSCREYSYEDDSEDEYFIDGVGFADPGGHSALRAETEDNPRDCACPTCGRENILTRIDISLGYQCDFCANEAERGF